MTPLQQKFPKATRNTIYVVEDNDGYPDLSIGEQLCLYSDSGSETPKFRILGSHVLLNVHIRRLIALTGEPTKGQKCRVSLNAKHWSDEIWTYHENVEEVDQSKPHLCVGPGKQFKTWRNVKVVPEYEVVELHDGTKLSIPITDITALKEKYGNAD